MDSVEAIGRAVLALGVVLFVLWVLVRAAARGKRRGGQVLDVLGRAQLTRRSAVAVIRVGDRDLVVGVTDERVSLLGEVDGLRVPRVVEAADGAAPVEPATVRPLVRPAVVPPVAVSAAVPAAAGPLAGSALSPATWKQSVEALRDLTVRSRVR